MIHWYRYLFFRIHAWRAAPPQTQLSDPEFDAALFISIANMFYLMGLIAVATAFSKSLSGIIFDDIGRTKLIAAAFFIGVLLFHEYIYVWSGNAKNIIKEFKSSNVTRFGTAAVLFYMVFSFLFFILAGILLAPSINERLPKF